MNLKEMLDTNGYLVYPNVGISMLPLLREGKDLMVIEKVNRPLRLFDAVLFTRPYIKGRGEYVLHRIVFKFPNGDCYIVGDNQFRGERVKKENILGILVKVKRDGEEIDCSSSRYKKYVFKRYASYPFRAVKHLFFKMIGKNDR